VAVVRVWRTFARKRWLWLENGGCPCPVLEPQPLFFQNMGSWPQDGTKIVPRSPQARIKTVLTCDRFLHRFSDGFWVVVGLRFSASWAPRAVQKSTQVAHAGHGEPQPLDFQNMSPALGESTIFTLLVAQDGTNIGPRSPQVGLTTVATCQRFLHRFSHCFLVVFRLRFGALMGPQGDPKNHLELPGRSKNAPK
jgi:hypothetical protein